VVSSTSCGPMNGLEVLIVIAVGGWVGILVVALTMAKVAGDADGNDEPGGAMATSTARRAIPARSSAGALLPARGPLVGGEGRVASLDQQLSDSLRDSRHRPPAPHSAPDRPEIFEPSSPVGPNFLEKR
jgi:hypothetical protein